MTRESVFLIVEWQKCVAAIGNGLDFLIGAQTALHGEDWSQRSHNLKGWMQKGGGSIQVLFAPKFHRIAIYKSICKMKPSLLGIISCIFQKPLIRTWQFYKWVFLPFYELKCTRGGNRNLRPYYLNMSALCASEQHQNTPNLHFIIKTT